MPVYNPPAPVVIEEENYPEVNVHADLPNASENEGVVYLVHTGTGVFGVNRKRAGMWRSDGTEWKRLGALTGSGTVVFGTAPSGLHKVYGLYARKVGDEYQPVMIIETEPEPEP